MLLGEKSIRKVKEIRRFDFQRSVFSKFQSDKKENLDKAYEFDKELAKLPKFIKDPEDLENSFLVFKEYYGPLKN
jgi:hypothetical protein